MSDKELAQLIFTKWSGLVAASPSGATIVGYLADGGFQLPAPTTPVNYPFLGRHQPVSLTVNLVGFTIPSGGSLLVELLNNGNQVPGFEVRYGFGQTGVQSYVNKDAKKVSNSVFDIRVTSAGLNVASLQLSATVQGRLIVTGAGPGGGPRVQ
jgi:hypothetical protein